MATRQELEQALINAHNAGDTNAARILAAELVRVRESAPTAIPGAQVTKKATPSQSIIDKAIGAGEVALSLGTGAIGGGLGMVGGALGGLAGAIKTGQYGTQEGVSNVAEQAAQGAQRLTYEPRTQAGQEMMNPISELMQQVIPVVALSPQLSGLAQGFAGARPALSATTQAAMAQASQRLQQARAATAPAVASLRESVTGVAAPEQAFGPQSVGAAQGVGAAQRVAVAESLPVPVKLTRGEALRDADQLGFEKAEIKMERGNRLRQRAEESSQNIAKSFDVMADQAGALTPDVVSAGKPVVDALMQGHQAAKNRTGAAYKRWRDSEESAAPVDTTVPVALEGLEGPTSFIEYLNKAPSRVQTSGVTDSAKQYAVQMGIASQDESGALVGRTVPAKTLEDFRREVTGLAKWDEPKAIRDETILKKLIDAQLDPVAGPLLTEARKARQTQAMKYENRAIVARLINNKKGMDDPIVAIDKVFDNTVLRGSPEELTFLKRVLKTSGPEGQQAWNELQGATVRYLQAEATKGVGMDSANNPIISPAKLNQAVQLLDKNGRLDVVLGKQRAQMVRDLNDVAKWVNTVPPGTLVNSSGTALALQSAVLETAANGVLFGLPAPVIGALRAMRNKVRDNKIRAKIDRALNFKPEQP